MRDALRNLRKSFVFTATCVFTIALAIGGNTSIFTVIRAVLLKPLNYRDPERLVRFSAGATPRLFEHMRSATRSLSGVVAVAPPEDLALSGQSGPQVLKGVRVSANFLSVLGAAPLLGRGFRPEEDRAGGAVVAMISAELWQSHFGGDSRIIGKTASLGTLPFTIVGVVPPRFSFPSADVDVWLTVPTEWPLIPPVSRPLSPYLALYGRIKDGATIAQANAEVLVIHRQYASRYPTMLDAKIKSPAELRPMREQLVSNVREMLWMLFGALGFVLLITCANVASLLLARGNFRAREFAIRAALGASRKRLAWQLLVESVFLSVIGGLAGLLIAAWSLRGISRLTPRDLPRAGDVHMDITVVLFAAGLSVLTGVLFGLGPSLAGAKTDLMRVLRGRDETDESGPRGKVGVFGGRGLLVTAQIALSVVLLVGSALLLKSVANLRDVDMGFNPSHLLIVRFSLPQARYDRNSKRASFFHDLVTRVNSSPGVQSAAAAMFLPLTGFIGSPIQDASKPILKLNERPIATILIVTPGYFRTMQIPLRQGRDFDERDADSAQRVIIIDESTARRFWPSYPAGESPLGKQLFTGTSKDPAQIIGIAASARQNLENTSWPDTVYEPFAQNPPLSAMLAIRTQGDPLRFTQSVRDQTREVDPDQALSAVENMQDLMEAELGQRRLVLILLELFAGMGLLLAIMGTYGVVAYSVGQREREVGVRRALGAKDGQILRMLIGQGLWMAFAGVALGIGGALALTRVLKSLLFHVSATDPVVFGEIAILFVAVVIAASYIPARRASRIDPISVLRG